MKTETKTITFTVGNWKNDYVTTVTASRENGMTHRQIANALRRMKASEGTRLRNVSVQGSLDDDFLFYQLTSGGTQ
jgi:hypothetical protein